MISDTTFTAHVEVCVRSAAFAANPNTIRAHVSELLNSTNPTPPPHSLLSNFEDNAYLAETVVFVRVCEPSDSLMLHIYALNEDDTMAMLDAEDDTENVAVSTTATTLPSPHFDGLWESLVFEDDILSKLLNYVSTSVLFADLCIDPHIISFNKVVLLHGPPGTGKTSLCRALSQKLSIRLSQRYPFLQLVEINSHSLFSKFFSESGKLVMKMFQNIKDLCDNPDVFVCVLIDEVESLTAARKAAVSGMEPSDAIRVVNALLTQIDSLKRRKNVLILTTSNITEAIDLAFVDRADLKIHIGLPSKIVIYSILASTLLELSRCGLLAGASPELLDWRSVQLFESNNCMDEGSASYRLLEIASICVGLSGRAIRKMPFIAHALFIKGRASVSLGVFLEALERAVKEEHVARAAM